MKYYIAYICFVCVFNHIDMMAMEVEYPSPLPVLHSGKMNDMGLHPFFDVQQPKELLKEKLKKPVKMVKKVMEGITQLALSTPYNSPEQEKKSTATQTQPLISKPYDVKHCNTVPTAQDVLAIDPNVREQIYTLLNAQKEKSRIPETPFDLTSHGTQNLDDLQNSDSERSDSKTETSGSTDTIEYIDAQDTNSECSQDGQLTIVELNISDNNNDYTDVYCDPRSMQLYDSKLTYDDVVQFYKTNISKVHDYKASKAELTLYRLLNAFIHNPMPHNYQAIITHLDGNIIIDRTVYTDVLKEIELKGSSPEDIKNLCPQLYQKLDHDSESNMLQQVIDLNNRIVGETPIHLLGEAIKRHYGKIVTFMNEHDDIETINISDLLFQLLKKFLDYNTFENILRLGIPNNKGKTFFDQMDEKQHAPLCADLLLRSKKAISTWRKYYVPGLGQ